MDASQTNVNRYNLEGILINLLPLFARVTHSRFSVKTKHVPPPG